VPIFAPPRPKDPLDLLDESSTQKSITVIEEVCLLRGKS
jgi:hypothetical protein